MKNPERYFPEYFPNGEPITLQRGLWFITQKVTTKETSPWRYMPNVADGKTPNPEGNVVGVNPVTQQFEVVRRLDEDEFQAWCDQFNYFRNGGKGIDPRLLIGGKTAFKAPYDCPKGKYWPNYGGRGPLFKHNGGGYEWG